MLEFEEIYGQFSKFKLHENPAKNLENLKKLKKVGVCEIFCSAFLYFNNLLNT